MKNNLNRSGNLTSPFGGGQRGRIFIYRCFFNFLILLLFFSCQNSKISYDFAKKEFKEYIITQKKSSLKKSYKLIVKNSDFQSNGLTVKNINIVIPIFIKMKKYDDLLNLLGNSNVLPQYPKEFFTNYIFVLKYKCIDKNMFYFHLNKNLEFIKSETIKNPNDSMKVFDYLMFKSVFVDKQKAINKIDSIKKITKFSNLFYENIVLQSINEIDSTEIICK